MTTAEQATIEKLGTMVFNAISELSYKGETIPEPDHTEALRRTAYAAVGVKVGNEPLGIGPKTGLRSPLMAAGNKYLRCPASSQPQLFLQFW